MEIRISRQAREKYQIDESLFSLEGNILLTDLLSVRVFVNKLNQKRDLIHFPERAAKTGEVNAIALMDEIFHYVIYLYRQQKKPDLFPEALGSVQSIIGATQLDSIFELFVKEFPPLPVYKKTFDSLTYLNGNTKGTPNRQMILEDLILYWVTLHNPALENYSDLFDSLSLTEDRAFHQLFAALEEYFSGQPTFGPDTQPLIELLLSPAQHVPHSITGQLEYIRLHWASFLGEYIYRILSSLDLLKEENKWSPGGGPGPMPVPVYDLEAMRAAMGNLADYEAFSQDRDWMPGLVLIAKNTYVWLDQLSRKYERPITRLDEIPLAELQTLAQNGITGLWLIGLWERSLASGKIKQMCGNPDAIASAYSLHSYEIAAELGGTQAYEGLRANAARFGIRLASDMVPNHMGIDSDWVIHHPERFLSLDHSPYPNYSFNGPDLSSDSGVVIQIEDHYYDRTDAAVVFRRIDKHSGHTRYIYHGNDGTSMPWNDTAQLDYLNAEVREAVYQTILEVARKFPIIRFDAAMTLAKKQVQRLWFPEPGSGGAIPSRSEYAMTREQFNAAMPTEFWRDVVDRIAVEAPDTLLLAEAFWMMEGYFVRTLGMHRVYNSAFMHMLRDENNSGYRQLLKNTLEFEPEILKRYVNFMNNPDERTAIDQFGKGDKYFGVCTLMATFPGLPMLGHGQVEGFNEKYGMEYKHAYLDEQVDVSLVERHQREIFPLLHKRHLFSAVENFQLFDFSTHLGDVINENVFAFTNRQNNEHTLVIYNNNYQSTDGWIRHSVAKLVKSGKEKFTSTCSLADALGLSETSTGYLTFRDQTSGLHFIRRVSQIVKEGFHMHLNGYETHVFLDFELLNSDASHDYGRLCDYLGEQGVPDIQAGLSELLSQPVLRPAKDILNAGYFKYLTDLAYQRQPMEKKAFTEAEEKLMNLMSGIEFIDGPMPVKESVVAESVHALKFILSLPTLESDLSSGAMKKAQKIVHRMVTKFGEPDLHTLLAWAFFGQLGNAQKSDPDYIHTLSWAEEWQFFKAFESVISQFGLTHEVTHRQLLALRLIINQQDWYKTLGKEPLDQIVKTWFSTPEIQSFLQVNRFKDILWYNREAFQAFLWWMFVIAGVKSQASPAATQSETLEVILGCAEIIDQLEKADAKSQYQVDKLLEIVEKLSR